MGEISCIKLQFNVQSLALLRALLNSPPSCSTSVGFTRRWLSRRKSCSGIRTNARNLYLQRAFKALTFTLLRFVDGHFRGGLKHQEIRCIGVCDQEALVQDL